MGLTKSQWSQSQKIAQNIPIAGYLGPGKAPNHLMTHLYLVGTTNGVHHAVNIS